MLALVLLAACAPEETTPADLLFSGGTVQLDLLESTSAIAVTDGVVVATGEEALARRGDHTAVVDLGGGHAWPGMHDAHVHLLAGSFAFDRLLLLGVASMDVIVSKVEDYAAQVPDEPWIIGYGWFTETVDEPNGVALDAVLPDRPALLVESSGHAALVNSAAMARCGIDASTPDPDGGSLGRDQDTGAPNGLLIEEALGLCAPAALADYDDDLLASGLLDALYDFTAGGITSVSEIMASPGIDLSRPRIYAELEAAGELNTRIFYYAPIFSLDDLDAVAELPGQYDGELVRFAGGKIWVDGSMGTGQAWTTEPHVDDPDDYGKAFFPADDLKEAVARAETLGVPLKLHANGDAAVAAALDAFEAAAARSGLTLPHVLEHAVLVSDADRERLADLGIPTSVQPAHYLAARLGDVAEQWGEERFDHAYDFRSLADAAVPLAMGTDWPVWPTADALTTVWAGTSLHEGNELTVDEGLAGYTTGGALAVDRAESLGQLHPGFFADFVVFDADPRAVAPGDLTDVRVTAVYLAGRKVK